jgi:2-oxoglutarate ferredoxin oxidoreductase subunit beta
MTGVARSLLGRGPDDDRALEPDDYTGDVTRWCSSCGDHSVLAAVKRLLAAEQLRPEKTVFVSGSGCASRLPSHVATYGFQGIHGRALPIATGIKLSRPDLSVFAVMGDGDCCSIGAAHWLHAVRTNLDMVALLLDNAVYAITGNQSSPTTPRGHATNTSPRGVRLPQLNPLSVTLGVANVSFVAQTADWIPAHLDQTLRAAYRHRGFSFVRVLQRCPKFSEPVFEEAARKPYLTEMLVHEEGIDPPGLESLYQNRTRHDPADFERGRRLGEGAGDVRIGLFFRDQGRPCYDELVRLPSYTPDEKIERLNAELDRHAV